VISRSNVIWFSALIFLVLVSAGFFLLRILPVMRDADSMQGELRSMISQRKEFISRPQGPPSEVLLRAAESARMEQEKIFQEAKANLAIEAPGLLPEGITRPSIYWLDTLKRKRRGISSRAGKADLGIPSGLGFADGLPSDDRVPELLFRLYVTEELIDKAIESGLRSVKELEFGESSDAPGLEDLDVKKVDLDFSAEASLENLLKFLKSLRSASFMYIVNDMSFKSVESERVEVEEAPDRAAARRPAARGIPPGDAGYESREERIEKRIVERYLGVNMKLATYYIPGREGVEIEAPAEEPAGEEPDSTAETSPEDDMPREPSERRRIVR
jgi:hypothetical protein